MPGCFFIRESLKTISSAQHCKHQLSGTLSEENVKDQNAASTLRATNGNPRPSPRSSCSIPAQKGKQIQPRKLTRVSWQKTAYAMSPGVRLQVEVGSCKSQSAEAWGTNPLFNSNVNYTLWIRIQPHVGATTLRKHVFCFSSHLQDR